jgi:hypothetical protein
VLSNTGGFARVVATSTAVDNALEQEPTTMSSSGRCEPDRYLGQHLAVDFARGTQRQGRKQ